MPFQLLILTYFFQLFKVESLRARIEEKQLQLDQKQEQLGRFLEDKSTGDAELLHLRDTMDVKDRKITVLMKKVSVHLIEKWRHFVSPKT